MEPLSKGPEMKLNVFLSVGVAAAGMVWANPWPATDSLGRELPTFEEVGSPRNDRYVAMFYFLWQNQHTRTGPHDISKILAQHPEARNDANHPAWGPQNHYHHFAEPLFGYYRSTDEWVYRKHAEMLADAGVDVIIFDTSNGPTYKESYDALFRAFDAAQKDGVKVPKIAFLCRFMPEPNQVRRLYEDIYKTERYENLWFYWKGKPLIMAYPEGTGALQDFFTFRAPKASYFDAPSRDDQWAWLEKYPMHTFGGTKRQPEQMAVGVAQNALSAEITALSDPRSMGRSFHDGKHDVSEGSYKYGLNFQEQWDYAIEKDPELIFVTGWNEWTAMRLKKFHNYEAPVVFVDLFDVEHSRDIEPMKGGYGDLYYYQLISNIRKFKGMAKPEISGVYSDYRGDTLHRDHPGWGNDLHYVNKLGRNDIIAANVLPDGDIVRFQVKTAAPLTRPAGDSWMLLLIDMDRDHSTGWEGYDFVLNRQGPGTLERNIKDWRWGPVCTCDVKLNNSELEISVSREMLGRESGSFDFEFKWVDNLSHPGDIMEFYSCGDVAPGGRFNYRFCE